MKAVGDLLRFVWRALVVVPVKLVSAVVEAAFRIGLAVGRAPVRVSQRAVRLAGVKGVLLFLVGLVVGLVLAPVPGRQLRARLRALAAGGAAPSDEELAATVTFELSHAPRTWHLTQPEVSVEGGRVTLTGAAPDDAARDELVTVVAGIPGVVDVVDRLEVDADEPVPEPTDTDD
ncbi:MAG: BON domain-containing protein [Acidimicrobiales bacterium]